MKTKMRLSDLKTGYLVDLRDGRQMMVVLGCAFENKKDILLDIENPKDSIMLNHSIDLKSCSGDRGLDIMRVIKLNTYEETLWERKRFEKDCLVNGSVAILRNGHKMMVMKDFKNKEQNNVLIDFKTREYDSFDAYRNDLTHIKDSNRDIIYIYFAENAIDFVNEIIDGK